MNHSVDSNPPIVTISKHSFSKRVRAHLASLREANTPEDRDYIIQSLIALGEDTGSELLTILNEPDDISRFCAAQALSLLKFKDAVPVLIEYLNHPNETIRWRCAELLCSQFQMLNGLPAVEKSALNADPAIREEAICALAKTQRIEAVPLLIAALEDMEKSIRRVAAHGLESFCDCETLPLRVLLSPHLSPQQKCITLEKMRTVRYRGELTVIKYKLPSIDKYCQEYIGTNNSGDPVNDAAQSVLDAWKNAHYSSELMRASTQSSVTDRTQLVRAVTGIESNILSDAQLRPSQAPEIK